MKFSASIFAPTATIVATTMLALSLNACGKTSSNGNASAMKSETSSKSDYQCAIQSKLESTTSDPNWSEVFDFKASDTTVTKLVGITNGGQYAGSISRETNSVGDRINLIISEYKTKSTSLAQFSEGADHLQLVTIPDGKFSIILHCAKK